MMQWAEHDSGYGDPRHASSHQCRVDGCRNQAVAWWPVIDPDTPSSPYCRTCLDDRKERVMVELLEGRGK